MIMFNVVSSFLFLTISLANSSLIFPETSSFTSWIFLLISSIFFYYGMTFFVTPVINALFLSTKAASQVGGNFEIQRPVAILYTTCDDFDPIAAESCVQQDYPCHQVYLLDDSSDPSFMRQVDAFKERHSNRVVLIRRKTRRGYKAGNINNGLKQLAKDVAFVLEVDADEVLPAGFLKATVARMMTLDDDIAFLQACSRGRRDSDKPFVRDLHVFVDIYWRHFLPLKDKYGFSATLGHGVLIRREALDSIGGFPELVSEDIALTLVLKEAGYDGVYESAVFGYESFPPSLEALRRRQYRWTKADIQLCLKKLRRFMFTKHLTWTERLDAMTREVKLPLTSLLAPATVASAALSLITPKSTLTPALFPLICLFLIVGLSPCWCYCWHLRQSPAALVKFIPQWFFVTLNMIFLHFVAAITFLINRRVIFNPTGAKIGRKARTNSLDLAVSLSPASTAFLLAEIGFGLTILLFAVLTQNLIFAAIAVAILGLVPVQKMGWQHPVSIFLQMLPFLLLACGVLSDILLGSFQLPAYFAILGLAMVLI